MIYCFLQHVSCFIFASSLNDLALYALCHVYAQIYILYAYMFRSACFMLYAMFCAQIYILHAYMFRSTCFMLYAIFYVQICVLSCLYVQNYMLYALCHFLCLDLHPSCLYVQICMVRVFMPCFLCFVPLFALCCCQGYVLTCLIPCSWLCFAQIYVLVCFLPCFMLRSAFEDVYMLGLTFFHVYVLVFTCSRTRFHAYAQIFVFTCLRARIQVFHMLICLDLCSFMFLCLNPCSMCLMPPSMCLCAPCHDCVLRLRLCLPCHVLLQPFCRFTFISCVLAYWFRLDLDPMVFVVVHTPQPTSKGLDHPVFHVYACLLLYFMLV